MAVASERRAAAMMYAELRNFTRMSEALDPEKVLALANHFFALVARCAAAHQGRPLGVQNDSLAVLFAAAAPAVATARDLQREFGPLGESWKISYGLPAAVAIGVHCGDVILGMAGPPSGQQFVAFGDCVSVAERLVHRARAGEIVMSLEVMKALGPAVRELGATELPALQIPRRPPLPIYAIVLDTRLDFT